MKKKLYPRYLSIGSKAAIISPSGNTDPLYIDSAITTLQNWGLNAVTLPFTYEKHGRFGGTLEQRLQDLQDAMDDKDIDLILCSRGGYGIVQLLDKINFSKIDHYPKWIIGYSDITALHLALLQNNIASLHSSMAYHLSENPSDLTSNYIKEILFGKLPEYQIVSHSLNRQGSCIGSIFGGNLAVLSSLIGTPYMKVPENGILFIEDIAESAYKIDRIMWQLKLSGTLNKISALIVGQFTDCNEDPLMGATIYESIKNIVEEYSFPIIFNFPVGHVKDNYPIIHGGTVSINVKENFSTLRFEIQN